MLRKIGRGSPILRMVGYPTFAIEHMMYGMALAAFILLTSPANATTSAVAATSRTPITA